MNIVKTLAVLIITSLVAFAFSKYLPEYHEVNKGQLQSLVKQLKYSENQEGTTDIDNILDTIPVRVALSYKGRVISSNIKGSGGDRASSGENNMQSLTKNVPHGDFILNYREDDEANKSLGLLIPLFTGLISALMYFLMSRSVENTIADSQSMREEIERLQTFNEMLTQRDEEYSRKIEKNIPDTLDEAQKLLKTMIKEKELIVAEMDKFNEKEEELRRDVGNSKMQLNKQKEANNALETKIRQLESQITGIPRLEKQIEDFKAKGETYAGEIKEYRSKLRAYEKTDIDSLKSQNSELKSKIAEADDQIKTIKEELKALKKLDPEKLQVVLEAGAQEKEEIKKELKQTKGQLKQALAGLEGTDVGKLQVDNIEFQKDIKSLQKELKEAREAASVAAGSSNPEELEELQTQLKAAREMSESLKSGVSSDVVSSLEDKQLIFSLQEKLTMLQEELDNKVIAPASVSGEIDEIINEKDEQINDMRRQLINKEVEVKKLRSEISGGGDDNSAMDETIDLLESDLQKSKNLALKYKKERDDKIKNINTLNEAFETANEALRRREEEIANIDEKYKSKISEVKAQLESQTTELTSLNNKYRVRIDELKAKLDKQSEELSSLKSNSDIQIPG